MVVGELDLERSGGENLNHGSDLAAEQTSLRKLDGQSNDIQEVNDVSRGLHEDA
jgi:hypothetical protein